jgi:hypothetical protein
MSVMRDSRPRFLRMSRLVSDVIATHVHAIDDHMLVAALGKVSLHGFVRTVCIPHEYREILLHDVIEALFDLCV